MLNELVTREAFRSKCRKEGLDVSVVSFARSVRNNYLDYPNPSYSSPLQMSILRQSFKESDGRSIVLCHHKFADAEVVYEGTWSRVLSSDVHAAAEFTTGAFQGLVGSEFSSNPMQDCFIRSADFHDGVAVVANSGYNIHHFLWEQLPAIYLHRELLENDQPLLIGQSDNSINAFPQTFLTLLGVRGRVVPMALRSRVMLKNTNILGTFPFRVYPIDLMREIVNRVLANASTVASTRLSKGNEVVFIGRGDGERNRRKLLNEDQVIHELQSHFENVRVIRPGMHPLTRTIQTVRNARIIVGPTAGALVHHLWARELEHFVELVPDGYPGDTESEELQQVFGYSHHRVTTTKEDLLDGNSWVDSNQNCPINLLRGVLTAIGPRFTRVSYAE